MNSIQLFTDSHKWCEIAEQIILQAFSGNVDVVRGKKGDKLPRDYGSNKYILTISFLSPFIIPKRVLDNSKLAVNFHPGNRYFPGSGCYNFALYQEAEEYGVVCHHMTPKVDTGPIILEENFPIFTDDTAESLQFRAYIALLSILQKFLSDYLHGILDVNNNIQWEAKPYLKSQLNEMQRIDSSLSREEFSRRVRAFGYPGFPLLVKSSNKISEIKTEFDEPLVSRIFL